MTRNENSYRHKGRAAFLAAIMVVSMVTIGAFAGGVAAEEPREETDPINNIFGELNYEGQTFNVTNASDQLASADGSGTIFDTVNITGDNSANFANPTDTVYLVRVTERDGGNISGAQTVGSSISVDGDTGGDGPYFELDLDNLDANEEYALSSASGSSGEFSTAFDISAQSPDLDIDDDSVTELDSDAEVTLDLDRNEPTTEYNVTIYARGPEDLDAEQIVTLFNHTGNTGTQSSVATNFTINRTVGDYSGDGDLSGQGDFVPFDTLENNYDFDVDSDARDQDEFETLVDEGVVTFELNSSQLGTIDELTLSADYAALDASDAGLPEAGEYTFTTIVTDTGASSTDTVEIRESDQSASFTQGSTQTPAGDISEFNLEFGESTSKALVQIGGEDSDFADVLYIEPDDASEPVNVRINTRLLGTNTTNTGAVYDDSNTDVFISEMHTGLGDTEIDSDADTDLSDLNNGLYGSDGDPLSQPNNFTQYLDEMSIIDTNDGEGKYDQLVRPAQPTDYEVQAAGIVGEDQAFDGDVGGEANDQLDSKVIELQQPEINGITTHTAPEESADDTADVEELVNAATERENIAIDDRAVIQVEATGIYGALLAGAGANGEDVEYSDFDRLEDGISSQDLYDLDENSNESIDFSVTAESSTGNQDALEVNLNNNRDSDTFVVLDEENGQFFLIVDTTSDTAFENGDAPDSAVDMTAELVYDADNDDNQFEFADDVRDSTRTAAPFSVRGDTSSNYVNYPYLQQGETLSGSAELTLEPRSFDFDNLNEDDQVQAQAAEDSEISGETNVAPGSDSQLRVSSTDASTSFRQGNDVNISSDGSVTTTYNLADQEVGDEFGIDFRVGGSSADTADGVIVESVGTDEPAETNETDEPADDGEEEPADDGEEEPADDGSADDGSTDDGTPGFGAVVALIALIGAALLAVRRQN